MKCFVCIAEMLGLNALFKHSHDLWLTSNIQVLTTDDATFELSVDKGRSEPTSPGHSTAVTGYIVRLLVTVVI